MSGQRNSWLRQVRHTVAEDSPLPSPRQGGKHRRRLTVAPRSQSPRCPPGWSDLGTAVGIFLSWKTCPQEGCPFPYWGMATRPGRCAPTLLGAWGPWADVNGPAGTWAHCWWPPPIRRELAVRGPPVQAAAGPGLDAAHQPPPLPCSDPALVPGAAVPAAHDACGPVGRSQGTSGLPLTGLRWLLVLGFL